MRAHTQTQFSRWPREKPVAVAFSMCSAPMHPLRPDHNFSYPVSQHPTKPFSLIPSTSITVQTDTNKLWICRTKTKKTPLHTMIPLMRTYFCHLEPKIKILPTHFFKTLPFSTILSGLVQPLSTSVSHCCMHRHKNVLHCVFNVFNTYFVNVSYFKKRAALPNNDNEMFRFCESMNLNKDIGLLIIHSNNANNKCTSLLQSFIALRLVRNMAPVEYNKVNVFY